MTGLLPWIVLISLILVLWLRDEVRIAPTKKDAPLPPPPSPDDFPEEDVSMPPLQTRVTEHDYSKDNEFCQKHPCDFMKPHRLPNGTLTYLCTNEEAWERWGIKEKVLESLNEGCLQQCARCGGLPCLGQRKGEKR